MPKKPTLKIKVGSDHVQAIAPKKEPPQDPYLEAITKKLTKEDDLPAASQPLPVLMTVTNPSTKSKFFVLGRTKEGLRVSIRFVAAHASGCYRIIFRVRVGDQDKGGYIENVYDLMKDRFPNVHFTATPVSTPDKRSIYPHASVEGVLQMDNVKPYESNLVEQGLDESPFIEELWYAAMVQFATAGYELDREQFGRWVKQQLLQLCHEAPPRSKAVKVHYKANGFMTSEKLVQSKKADLADAGLV